MPLLPDAVAMDHIGYGAFGGHWLQKIPLLPGKCGGIDPNWRDTQNMKAMLFKDISYP